jgi:hypothetical protein
MRGRLLGLFLLLNLLLSVLVWVPSVGAGNIWSDGEFLFMGMEDGVKPYFQTHRATHSVDYNSTIHGTYCLNATYTLTPSGAFLDRFYFDDHIRPTTWSMKFIVDDYTNDSRMSFLLNRHSFGATIMGLEMYPLSHKFDTYVVGIDYFIMPLNFNTIYKMIFSNIDYAGYTYDLTIENATASETKTNIAFYTSAAGNIELDNWEFRGTDAFVNHRLYYDDWTVGQQAIVSTNASSSVEESSAVLNGFVGNDGSTFQNGTQINLSTGVCYGNESKQEYYSFYFNEYVAPGWLYGPECMVNGNDASFAGCEPLGGDPYVRQVQYLNNHSGNYSTIGEGNISSVQITARVWIGWFAYTGDIIINPKTIRYRCLWK